MTHTEYAEKHGITLRAETRGSGDLDGLLMVEFAVTLEKPDGSTHTLPFFMGTGCIDWKATREKGHAANERGIGVKAGTDVLFALNTLARKPHAELKDRELHKAAVEYAARVGCVQGPTVGLVLCHLCDEVRDWDMRLDESFEQWATDRGYDPDSRKMFATYQRILASGSKVSQFLAPHTLEFVECEE